MPGPYMDPLHSRTIYMECIAGMSILQLEQNRAVKCNYHHPQREIRARIDLKAFECLST